jgi:hypothetical protein
MVGKYCVLVSLLLFMLPSCNKSTSDTPGLKEIAARAKRAGYDVTYKDSFIVKKPDLKNVADPKIVGQPGK